MKFTIERDDLLKALVQVQGVIEKRNTMPILSNLLLDGSDKERLRIVATDLEIGITTVLPAKISQPGKMTLHARNLFEITKQLPSQEVSVVSLPNHDAEITCGKIMFKLHGLGAEDFPSLPKIDGKTSFSFSTAEFATMIDHTIFSVSTDETRFNLSGVYMEKGQDGTLRMVSSDGHRLSLIDRKLGKVHSEFPDNVIVPRKGLMEIRKLCAEVEGELDFQMAKANLVVNAGETTLVVRLIDGEFPDYRQVLPAMENLKKLLMPREAFLNALRRISILSQEKTRGIRFQFERNLLKISVNNPDLGEAEEELEIQYDHPPLEIGFNAKYFMDVLGLLKDESVYLYVSDSMSQGLLVPTGDEHFKAVIMPMKLL